MASVLVDSNVECPYVQRAFESATDNIQMMTIERFIEKSGFPIDDFMVGNFFKNLDKKLPIYITNELIEWCGFGATKFDDKKLAFNRLLKRFVLDKDYWVYKNKAYSEFYKLQSATNIANAHYPNPTSFDGKNRTNHIIITSICFEKILLILDTPKSDTIREHYIQMKNLTISYIKYQCVFNNRSYETTLNAIKNMSHVKAHRQLQRIKEIEADIENKNRIGVIYFICEKNQMNLIKIGYTYHLPSRFTQLQCANPRDLIVMKSYFAQHPYFEEQLIHETYKKYNVRGEWFMFPMAQFGTTIDEVLISTQKLVRDFNELKKALYDPSDLLHERPATNTMYGQILLSDGKEHGQFILIQLNDRMYPFKFYVIRGKRPYATTSKNQILAKHRTATIILEYTFQANAMNLFVLIKEELGTKGRGVIGTLNNYIKLVAPYTEDMFIADVRRIEDSKKEI